ncbi:TonB-dependent receptor [Candidatus Palauibacter sp.]|uniref:TonB-dependent receptor n=1 Tax=Candidatus Palauibacter sp. TaxID=3101350 RepID=UPI003B029259
MTRPFAGACLALLLAIAGAEPALGQDPPPPDTLGVRLDSLEVIPDSVRAQFADSTPPRAQQFPGRLIGLRGPGHEIFDCDRDCVQSSPAVSLLELLLERVPGMTGIRGGYFTGPHYAFDGAFGPGFVTLYVDGREVPSLERAQTDLRRVSLNYVDRVRVYRGADGLVIDVDLIRHDGVRAYSRVAGGTGDPRTEILDAVFANRLGSTFNVEVSFERRAIDLRDAERDRFGAKGRLSWMPRSNDFGVQLEYRTESTSRLALDTLELGRKEVILRTRANLGERAQLEAYGHTTNFNEVVPGLPDSIPGPRRGADGVGLRLSARPGPGAVSLGLRFAGRDAYASRVADLAAWQPIGPLALEAGAELASWNEFPTKSWRGGLAFRDTLLIPIALRGFAAGGTRGVGFPEHPMADSLDMLDLVAADSVGFSARGASAAFGIGPFDLSGRYSRQRLDRVLPFGAAFDREVVADSGEVDITSYEARFEGPVVPLGLLLRGVAPIRLRASWRKFESEGAQPLFLPDRLFRTELLFHDTAFSGNLHLWLSVFIDRRGARLSPLAGSAEPVMLEADSWMGGHFMFKIGDFRFFWHFGNLGAGDLGDFPGTLFPVQVNVFGLRWEFFN